MWQQRGHQPKGDAGCLRRLAAACGGKTAQCRALRWEKKELVGNSDCCRCFGTAIGPLTDSLLTAAGVLCREHYCTDARTWTWGPYHPSTKAWEPGDGGLPQPQPKGFAEGAVDAAARSAGAPCLIDPPGPQVDSAQTSVLKRNA